MKEFKGPVFIIGMPRSGTKLLRDLLNRNTKINIPIQESHFIPFFIRKFGLSFDFKSDDNFYHLYKALEKTNFFIEMKKKGMVLEWNNFLANCNRSNWSTVLEFILKYYASEDNCRSFIWGDKTPGYINHMSLLNIIFPSARFIHIIRDPRDYCLSVKKIWNKNVYRAANRWYQTIDKLNGDKGRLCSNYYEIKYEDLLSNPKIELRNICDFLSCDYSDAMTTLEKSLEFFGDAKGSVNIVSSNKNKFINEFSESTIKRIEEITYPILKKFEYPIIHTVEHKPLNKWEENKYKIYDAIAILKFQVKYGHNLHEIFNSYAKSSWRL